MRALDGTFPERRRVTSRESIKTFLRKTNLSPPYDL
jgi:hypothetical protein